jgi:hypothetical protein
MTTVNPWISRKPAPRTAAARLTLALLALVFFAPDFAGATAIDASLRLDPTSPAGADAQGRVLVYTPNPLEGGSSVSHWDPSTTPNLLMEPANNRDLPFAGVDLTLPLFQDTGWRRGRSQLTIRIQDSAGTGFNDPDLGAQRRAAIEFVAQVWGSLLASPVEINVGVSFQSQDCDDTGAVLAFASPQFIFESFQGAPVGGTWHAGPLAESLSGQNLSLEDVSNPDAADIEAVFNPDIDTGCLGSGSRFYYGLDGNVPVNQISFVNVALHELGHGLGFLSLVDPGTGAQLLGLPDAYSRLLFDNDLGRTWANMTNAQRRISAVNSQRVAWSGQRVTTAARNLLEPGPVVTVSAPQAIAGNYRVATAQFGPPLTTAGLAGQLAIARDGSAEPNLVCAPVANAAEIAGKIALIDRGTCLFVDKVKNAQNAGAVGVIIVNNVPDAPIGLGGDDPSIVIPSVHLSQADGALLKEVLTVGLPPLAPSDLSAEALPGGRARLAWTDNSDDETSFRIERRRGTARFTEIASVGAGVTTFEDSGLEAGVAYDYRVRARNAAGNSAFSNLASVEIAQLPPQAPLDLEAEAVSATEVALAWTDRSSDEDTFVLERRTVATRGGDGTLVFIDSPFEEVALIPADVTTFALAGLTPATTYNFRLRARNANGDSEATAVAPATTRAAATGPCAEDPETLCLLDGRFSVRSFFKEQRSGNTGSAMAIPDSDETGLFWFFNPANVELVVKLLDARSFSGAFWVFYGALSDVEYWIVVTDTETGAVKTYTNEPGNICGNADTRAFPEPAGGLRAPAAGAPWQLAVGSLPAAALEGQTAAGTTGGCAADAETLCLRGDRFQVTVTWRDQRSGNTGTGMAIPSAQSDTTGFFWFFSPTNTELVLKVIDGSPVNGHFWVFYGALSDVEYTIEVVDTANGNRATYTNPPGNFCGIGDNEALPGDGG